MKKLVLMLVLFVTGLFANVYAQVIGVYCDKTTIAPYEEIELRFVVSNGPIRYFCYTDSTDFCTINMVGNEYVERLAPHNDTRYTLTYVEPGSIDPQHAEVFVHVTGNDPYIVHTSFTPPSSCYETDAPIDLLPYFWANVPNYKNLVEFDGPGVEGCYFKPNQSGGPGIKSIRAHLPYNNIDYGVTSEIKVIRFGTGISEECDERISISPNPTQGVLNISEPSCRVVEIYSATGLLLRKFEDMTTVDISDFPSGMYMVRLYLENQDQPTVKKIIKQ